MFFDTRIDLREGADGAGNGAGRDFLARGDEALAAAGKFRVSLRQLETERGWLGVNTVRAADGRRHLVFEGAALERGEQRVEIGQQNIGGTHQLDVEAGIEHVRRRHARMHVARLGSDDFGHVGQEGDDVVFDFRFDGVDAGDVELGVLALGPDGLGSFFRDDAELSHSVGGMRLDLEPDAEFGFGRPDRHHVGTGITRNHAASPRANAPACRIASMFAL